MKSNSVMTRSVIGNTITWLYRDGESVSIDVAGLSQEIRDQATIHGVSQKVADSAAMSVDPQTGKPATIEAKRAAMVATIDNLVAGKWNGDREAGEGGMLLEALVRYYASKNSAKTRESIVAHLATLTDKQKTALRTTSAHLKPFMDEIRAERGRATGVDPDELLDGFDAEPVTDNVEATTADEPVEHKKSRRNK